MLTKESQPSGMDLYEGTFMILSMGDTGKTKRFVKIQWIGITLPLLTCTDITDDEWELLQTALKSDKRIFVAAKHPIKTLKNFHDVYMFIP